MLADGGGQAPSVCTGTEFCEAGEIGQQDSEESTRHVRASPEGCLQQYELADGTAHPPVLSSLEKKGRAASCSKLQRSNDPVYLILIFVHRGPLDNIFELVVNDRNETILPLDRRIVDVLLDNVLSTDSVRLTRNLCRDGHRDSPYSPRCLR